MSAYKGNKDESFKTQGKHSCQKRNTKLSEMPTLQD
jgi:hypothetical protein